ncbi:MFS transporter, partial [Mesorhizobium sp. M4A.F.Ca.ET.090.04.2.1]
ASLASRKQASLVSPFPRRKVMWALAVLTLLVLTKNAYIASISSYYTFYAIHKFGVSVQISQVMLFLFLGASALGILLGGPFGDRYGQKAMIWFSIVGVLPFTLALPYANLEWTMVLTVLIGLILSSAFSNIVVFAQELVPGRVGMIAGIFFGFAFGMGGIAAAVLGVLADMKGIDFVYQVCSYLPLLGLLTVFLPNMKEARKAEAATR